MEAQMKSPKTTARCIHYLPAGLSSGKFSSTPPHPLIGVLEGSGIGPSVIAAALKVLKSVEEALGFKCEVRQGGLIGEEAVK